MQTLAPGARQETLSETQRAALISLLADEDPSIYQAVRKKLVSCGSVACQWLRPHTLSDNPVMRRRAQEVVHHLGRLSWDERFLEFCLHGGEDLDLEVGAGLLARTEYPEVNVEAYQALYDEWAGELRERLEGKTAPEQVLGTLNRYFFEELRFFGDEHYGQSAENCYLNRVVDRRTGNPISLCAIYLFVARRLQLPIAGIGLPGHFICRYQSSTKELYIDVFRQGTFWTKADCVKYLLQASYGLQDGYLTPVSSRRILLRMCVNLHQTYARLEESSETARIRQYVVALGK